MNIENGLFITPTQPWSVSEKIVNALCQFERPRTLSLELSWPYSLKSKHYRKHRPWSCAWREMVLMKAGQLLFALGLLGDSWCSSCNHLSPWTFIHYFWHWLPPLITKFFSNLFHGSELGQLLPMCRGAHIVWVKESGKAPCASHRHSSGTQRFPASPQ